MLEPNTATPWSQERAGNLILRHQANLDSQGASSGRAPLRAVPERAGAASPAAGGWLR